MEIEEPQNGTEGDLSLDAELDKDQLAQLADPADAPVLKSWWVGKDLDWDSPLIDVYLWAELPFWLMTGDGSLRVEHAGIGFQVTISSACHELFMDAVTDSRRTVQYLGPWPPYRELLDSLEELRENEPRRQFAFRKCKTVVKIPARCHERVFEQGFAGGDQDSSSAEIYRAELCRAHIPVLNSLIQHYRLATYDNFAFEVSPWDVPSWMIERDGRSVTSYLLPYKQWDHKPELIDEQGERSVYELIGHEQLSAAMNAPVFPGELELMDALSLMRRGDYSGAVRRITTAIEVAVEAAVYQAISAQDGEQAAKKYIKKTRMKFFARIKKFEEMSGRAFPGDLRKQLNRTRDLRHRIVHGGHRISAPERGVAQQSVDTGRWIVNFFEHDQERMQLRETRLGLRALGRDMDSGILAQELTDEGIVIGPMKVASFPVGDLPADEPADE